VEKERRSRKEEEEEKERKRKSLTESVIFWMATCGISRIG
jgi:hypothetical protein